MNNRPDLTKPAVVYAIIDPYSKEVVYIGYTMNYKNRVSYHLNCGWEQNKKAKYVKSLKEQGVKPEFKIIGEFENVELAKAFELEKIKELKPIYNTK